MGYKGFIRSVSAASNRARRKSERRERQQAKAVAQFQRKASKIEEQQKKILAELDEEYAKGKVTKEKYDELRKRADDISLELLVFGKSSGVSLGKRYITGKIDQAEFERVKKDILPPGVVEEKGHIDRTIEDMKEKVADFEKNCQHLGLSICKSCGKQKSLLGFFKETDGMLLCGRCARTLKSLRTFPGFSGVYFKADACYLELGKNVSVSIKQEHL